MSMRFLLAMAIAAFYATPVLAVNSGRPGVEPRFAYKIPHAGPHWYHGKAVKYGSGPCWYKVPEGFMWICVNEDERR